MTVIAYSILMLLAGIAAGDRGDACLEDASLRDLDAGWERSLLKGDTEFLAGLLAGDFVWVHDHASAIDSRTSLLGWVSADESGMSSRTQSEVETRRLDKTGIVMGYTVVTRRSVATRYRFMRTYVETDGACLLLANQTMVTPDGE